MYKNDFFWEGAQTQQQIGSAHLFHFCLPNSDPQIVGVMNMLANAWYCPVASASYIYAQYVPCLFIVFFPCSFLSAYQTRKDTSAYDISWRDHLFRLLCAFFPMNDVWLRWLALVDDVRVLQGFRNHAQSGWPLYTLGVYCSSVEAEYSSFFFCFCFQVVRMAWSALPFIGHNFFTNRPLPWTVS